MTGSGSGAGPLPAVASVHPVADAGVVAAIAAAVVEVWPRPVVVVDDGTRRPGAVWRFSGRWWAKPSTARRDRPWAGR